jgi:GNAT superfamily N-acetyltransferase
MFASADRALVRRIETANAAMVAEFGQAAAGGAVEALAGGIAVFAGADSPATHAVGIGLAGPVTAEEFDRLEAFFRDRGAACTIDLPAPADLSLLEFIRDRRYRVVELNYVLARGRDDRPPSSLKDVRVSTDARLWAAVVCRGFSEGAEPSDAAIEMACLTPPSMVRFLADLDGEPVAGAAMSPVAGVAWMYGDATLPRCRGRGLQRSLIAARLDYAFRAGCDLAVAAVLPASGSHRNYERAGFQLLYMTINVRRDW